MGKKWDEQEKKQREGVKEALQAIDGIKIPNSVEAIDVNFAGKMEAAAEKVKAVLGTGIDLNKEHSGPEDKILGRKPTVQEALLAAIEEKMYAFGNLVMDVSVEPGQKTPLNRADEALMGMYEALGGETKLSKEEAEKISDELIKRGYAPKAEVDINPGRPLTEAEMERIERERMGNPGENLRGGGGRRHIQRMSIESLGRVNWDASGFNRGED